MRQVAKFWFEMNKESDIAHNCKEKTAKFNEVLRAKVYFEWACVNASRGENARSTGHEVGLKTLKCCL